MLSKTLMSSYNQQKRASCIHHQPISGHQKILQSYEAQVYHETLEIQSAINTSLVLCYYSFSDEWAEAVGIWNQSGAPFVWMAAKYTAIKYKLRAPDSRPWQHWSPLGDPRAGSDQPSFWKSAFDKYFQQYSNVARQDRPEHFLGACYQWSAPVG